MLEVGEHNYERQKTQVAEDAGMMPGDVLEVERGLYKHVAIYLGRRSDLASRPDLPAEFSEPVVDRAGPANEDPGMVAHFTANAGARLALLRHVRGDCRIKNATRERGNGKQHTAKGEDIVGRTLRAVREVSRDYNVVLSNCEHWARHVRDNTPGSRQVEQYATGALGATGAAIGGAVGGPLSASAGALLGTLAVQCGSTLHSFVWPRLALRNSGQQEEEMPSNRL